MRVHQIFLETKEYALKVKLLRKNLNKNRSSMGLCLDKCTEKQWNQVCHYSGHVAVSIYLFFYQMLSSDPYHMHASALSYDSVDFILPVPPLQ